MKLEIEISGIKPLSLNHYTKITTRGKFASKYKTKEAQEFEKEIASQLVSIQDKFTAFNTVYDSKCHYLAADYRFYFPFMTKKNLIAKRKNDIDNIIKPLQDNIFKLMKPDDSEIINLSATKIHSNELKIKVTYHMYNLSNIA